VKAECYNRKHECKPLKLTRNKIVVKLFAFIVVIVAISMLIYFLVGNKQDQPTASIAVLAFQITEESLSELEKRKKLRRSDGNDYHLAAIYASRGDKERALQHLQDYRDNVIFLPPYANLIPLGFIQHDIMFENLWDNEEFQTIVRRDQEEKETVIAQLREMEEQGELDL